MILTKIAILGGLGVLWGRSGGPLGRSWGALGRSWADFGRSEIDPEIDPKIDPKSSRIRIGQKRSGDTPVDVSELEMT